MDVREKLVELLGGCPCEIDCEGMVGSCPNRKHGYCNEIFKLSYCSVSKLAQHLIAHGVTVQEWISVEDRLPDSCGFPCLLCGENSFGQIRVFEGFTGYMERGKREWHSNQKDVDIDVWTITHWMPLPEPPEAALKGGEG